MYGIDNLDDGEIIVQILQAEGWKAIYVWSNAPEKDAIGILPVVCWALVEDKDRKRNVFAVTACPGGELGLLRNDGDREFYRLLGPHEKVEDIREVALKEWRRRSHE